MRILHLGRTASALQSEYLTGSGRGFNLGEALVAEINAFQGLTWTAGFQNANHEVSGNRISNNGVVNFAEVETTATQISFGVEYNMQTTLAEVGFHSKLMAGASKTDSFREVGGASNELDVMKVDPTQNEYAGLDFGMKFGSAIKKRTKLIGSIDTFIPLNPSLIDVAASYDQGQGAFSVNSRGLDGASLSTNFGNEHALIKVGTLPASVGLGNTWNGETKGTASFGLRHSFSSTLYSKWVLVDPCCRPRILVGVW
jgi:hypothetical protein